MKINSNGEVTLIALTIALALFTLTIYLYFTLNKVETETISRSKSYICTRKITALTDNLIRSYQKSNDSIKALNALITASTTIPKVAFILKQKRKYIITVSTTWLFSYRAKILKYKECSKLTKTKIIAKPPIKTAKLLLPKRDLFGMVEFKEQWTFKITQNEIKLEIKRRFNKEKKWSVKESSNKTAFNYLKLLSGSVY